MNVKERKKNRREGLKELGIIYCTYNKNRIEVTFMVKPLRLITNARFTYKYNAEKHKNIKNKNLFCPYLIF